MDLVRFNLKYVDSIIVYKNKEIPVAVFNNVDDEFVLVEENDTFFKEMTIALKNDPDHEDSYYFEQRVSSSSKYLTTDVNEEGQKEKTHYTFCMYTIKLT
jgi:hypothetical protein